MSSSDSPSLICTEQFRERTERPREELVVESVERVDHLIAMDYQEEVPDSIDPSLSRPVANVDSRT